MEEDIENKAALKAHYQALYGHYSAGIEASSSNKREPEIARRALRAGLSQEKVVALLLQSSEVQARYRALSKQRGEQAAKTSVIECVIKTVRKQQQYLARGRQRERQRQRSRGLVRSL